jgi:surface protein
MLSLPDILKWNTKNIENINNIFKGCSSLISLPDISKWNLPSLTDDNNKFDFMDKSLSSKSPQFEENTISIYSDNSNSSKSSNHSEKSNFNEIKEYKIENIDFSFENDSLNSYYDIFYS